jgi:hypothetical protein
MEEKRLGHETLHFDGVYGTELNWIRTTLSYRAGMGQEGFGVLFVVCVLYAGWVTLDPGVSGVRS